LIDAEAAKYQAVSDLALNACGGLGKSSHRRFLHEMTENGSSAERNYRGYSTCDDERAHDLSPESNGGFEHLGRRKSEGFALYAHARRFLAALLLEIKTSRL
jgi:hypothetical protein